MENPGHAKSDLPMSGQIMPVRARYPGPFMKFSRWFLSRKADDYTVENAILVKENQQLAVPPERGQHDGVFIYWEAF